jgi:hypothetical protein
VVITQITAQLWPYRHLWVVLADDHRNSVRSSHGFHWESSSVRPGKCSETWLLGTSAGVS